MGGNAEKVEKQEKEYPFSAAKRKEAEPSSSGKKTEAERHAANKRPKKNVGADAEEGGGGGDGKEGEKVAPPPELTTMFFGQMPYDTMAGGSQLSVSRLSLKHQ
jgi:hypothetical protein